MQRPKPTTEARCKNCRLCVKIGNKLYCTKEALQRTFPYNTCLEFDINMKEDGG